MSPLDAAALLAGKRGRVVMVATPGDEARRWSFVAAEPSATLIARGRSLVVLDADGRPTRRFTGDPLDAAEAFLAEHDCRLAPCSAAPAPRVFGYLGYDLARVVERLPGGAALGHDGPDLWLGAYGAVARWSPDDGAAIVGADPEACAALTEALSQPARPSLPPSLGPLAPEDDDAHHTARIERVRDHLAAGDVDRVHLARRLVARIAMPGDALAVHAALTEAAPAAYHALLETDGAALVTSSPARFLASVGDHEPWADPATTAGTGYAVLLRAMFPADAITGAPRLRAMEVIDELEPVRRGPYGGAIGYFGPGGAFDLALAVRLGVIAQNELYVHAGAAIAAGSDAAAVLARTESDAAPWRATLDELARQRSTPPG